jgi:two-component system, cell cycle sensor histidine kinase and response regulator CckA
VTEKGRILLMDDEELVRDVLGGMLECIGYEVTHAQDGSEAIALYKTASKSDQPFDTVIMDLTVPGGMGGRETIRHLLAIDPEVKALISSGYSDDPIMSSYHEFGFRGAVSKPCKLGELERVLHEVMTQ